MTYVVLNVTPSAGPALFIGFAPIASVVLWARRDARLFHVPVVVDWGWFLMMFSPFTLPWYAVHTRGWKGLRLLAALVGILLAPLIGAIVAGALRWQHGGSM